jgi:hypothetical protein
MRGHRVTITMVGAVALAACGPSADDALPADTVSDTATTTPTTTLTTTPTTDGRPENGSDDVIESVRWGPDDPPIPDEYRVFAADRAGAMTCEAIDNRAEGDEFWTLARDICRVFTGEGEWPDATSVPPPPQEGNAYQRCLDGELSHMLGNALAWHAAHPGAVPIVRFPSSGTHSPCQTSLYDVAVTDLGVDPGGGCNNDTPSGVPTPGIPVTISAPGITGFANPRATLGGTALCVIADSPDSALRTFVVVVPTSGDAQTATIDVETNYGTLTTTVELPAIDVASTVTTTGSTDRGDTTPDGTTGATVDEHRTPDDP